MESNAFDKIIDEGFERTNITKVNPIKAGSKASFTFPYKSLEKDMIESVRGTCSCSTPTWDDNGVHVSYHDSTAKGSIPKNTGVLAVNKLIIVYLKDGSPLKIKNDKGVEVWNPDKTQIPLQFNVSVVP